MIQETAYETGRTCPYCGDLAPWNARACHCGTDLLKQPGNNLGKVLTNDSDSTNLMGMKSTPKEGVQMYRMEYSVRGCSRISTKIYDTFEEADKAKKRWESSNSTGHYWATLHALTVEEQAAIEDERRGAITEEEFSALVDESDCTGGHGFRSPPMTASERIRILRDATAKIHAASIPTPPAYFIDGSEECDSGRWDDDPNPYHGTYSEE